MINKINSVTKTAFTRFSSFSWFNGFLTFAWKKRFVIGVLLIFIIHCWMVLNFCPDGEILFRNSHFLNHDYNLHYYCCYTTSYFIKTSFRFWGYDPFFQAGYPASALADLSSKLWEIFVCCFSFLGEARAFNFYVLLSFFIVPLLLFKTARNHCSGKWPT